MTLSWQAFCKDPDGYARGLCANSASHLVIEDHFDHDQKSPGLPRHLWKKVCENIQPTVTRITITLVRSVAISLDALATLADHTPQLRCLMIEAMDATMDRKRLQEVLERWQLTCLDFTEIGRGRTPLALCFPAGLRSLRYSYPADGPVTSAKDPVHWEHVILSAQGAAADPGLVRDLLARARDSLQTLRVSVEDGESGANGRTLAALIAGIAARGPEARRLQVVLMVNELSAFVGDEEQLQQLSSLADMEWEDEAF